MLHQRLREYILGDLMGVGYGDDYQRRVAQGGLPELGSPVIRVHNSAVLAADLVWSTNSFDLQPVRAHPDCFGAPWFDCVAVRMLPGTRRGRGRGRGGADAELQYAHLLLLFQAQLPLADYPSCTEWEGLAYVRWFKVEPTRGDVLSQYKVLERDQALGLSWEESSTQLNSCGIIPLSSIVRRVHVVPAFESGKATAKSGRFHLNPFKY